MSAPDEKQQMQQLEERLAAYKKATGKVKAHQEEHYSQANIAWRMVTEMVAGLGIGFGIGYGLDMVLGTTPWLMVVFALLGIAAGINVMLRTAKDVQARHEMNGADAPVDDKSAARGADEGNRDGH
ncbi:AtpZ/AtpI family protein [Sagittula salina]|uniref:ATP synthase protein I n=1 Tax=Sagittula salina TaxID=2820268 RepID=A0A940MIZ7_9RHOB|nr:AtpZ/AtpI family protein [Sagittula salina]MBP0482366.1 AtpZ/AtpI family protein [Sagittula salina]